jgi:hypothetical protein
VTILRLVGGIAGVALLGLSIVWLAWQDRQEYHQKLNPLAPQTSPETSHSTIDSAASAADDVPSEQTPLLYE